MVSKSKRVDWPLGKRATAITLREEELIDKEEKYLDALKLVIFKNEEELKSVYDILNFHQTIIIPQLQKLSEVEELSKIFIDHEKDLQLYVHYAWEISRMNTKMNLADLIPNHIEHYLFLFTHLLANKHLHTHKNELKRCQNIFILIREQMFVIEHCLSKLDESPIDVKEYGSVLQHHDFKVKYNKSSKKKRHLFLFEKIILFTKFDPGKGRYIYDEHIPVTKNMIISSLSYDCRIALDMGPEDQYQLICSHDDIKRRWCSDIRNIKLDS